MWTSGGGGCNEGGGLAEFKQMMAKYWGWGWPGRVHVDFSANEIVVKRA